MTINIDYILRKTMGWCPVADTKISKPASGEGYANKPESAGDPSRKLFGSLFKWDYIVKVTLFSLRQLQPLSFS
jgi:hypothetical protein